MKYLIDTGSKEFGDCDDHAIYWITALLQSELCDRAWLGTVWVKKPGTRSGIGHALCVFEVNSQGFWTDYGLPRTWAEPWEWAEQVAAKIGGPLLAAATTEVFLKRGEPHFRKRIRSWVP